MTMADVLEQCLDELVAGTKGLKLSIVAEEIRKQRLEYQLTSDGHLSIKQWQRGIIFFPMPEAEAPGTHGRDDIGYGIGLAIALPVDSGQATNTGRASEIRAKIRRRFVHQRLTTVTLSGGYYLTTGFSHLQIHLPREAHRFEVSAALIRCWMRESRG
jgi:hypothetical protein